MTEEKFAGLVVTIDDEVVAKITSITSPSLTISEAEISGSEDIVSGGDIIAQQFASIAVNEVANVEGIVWIGDQGQSDLKAAARAGVTASIEWIGPSGNGLLLSGFFQSYQETRTITDVAKFTSTFRVNETTPIVAGS